MLILGIDSAETSGLALVERDAAGNERLHRHGAELVRSYHDIDRLAGEWTRDPQPHLVVVEEPFVHPRYPLAGLVLARLLGRWLQAFEGRGFATATVPASMWQTSMLPGVTRWTRSELRKAAAVRWVRERYGAEVGEDAADAIVLATWVARNS